MKKVSIIFIACDTTQLLRQITLLALQSIIQYTDEEDYELIFIDTIKEKEYKLDDAYNSLELNQRPDRQWIKRYTSDTPDPGQYECYNIGAKLATGDYLCFYQNDVFVREGWLKDLRYYLDNKLADMVIPDQIPRKRQTVKDFYSYKLGSPKSMEGWRDAGLIMMTKEAYDKVGGWEGRMRISYGEKALYQKADDLGLNIVVTNKTQILHIAAASTWHKKEFHTKEYDDEQTISSRYLRENQ